MDEWMNEWMYERMNTLGTRNTRAHPLFPAAGNLVGKIFEKWLNTGLSKLSNAWSHKGSADDTLDWDFSM